MWKISKVLLQTLLLNLVKVTSDSWYILLWVVFLMYYGSSIFQIMCSMYELYWTSVTVHINRFISCVVSSWPHSRGCDIEKGQNSGVKWEGERKPERERKIVFVCKSERDRQRDSLKGVNSTCVDMKRGQTKRGKEKEPQTTWVNVHKSWYLEQYCMKLQNCATPWLVLPDIADRHVMFYPLTWTYCWNLSSVKTHTCTPRSPEMYLWILFHPLFATGLRSLV